MTLHSNELFSSVSRGPVVRMHPAQIGGLRTLRLAPDADFATARLLPVGTPLAYNSMAGTLAPLDQDGMNGANVIIAFIAEKPVQLHATQEVLAVCLYRGSIERDDVNTAAIRAVCGGDEVNNPTANEMDTALAKAGLRNAGLDVLGLANAGLL